MSIIKNPLVLGVIAGALTYGYLVWNKKNKKDTKKEISLVTPIIVALAVCIVAHLYFNSPQPSMALRGDAPTAPPIESSSDSAASFHLISKGLNIPNNVPEVFIETY